MWDLISGWEASFLHTRIRWRPRRCSWWRGPSTRASSASTTCCMQKFCKGETFTSSPRELCISKSMLVVDLPSPSTASIPSSPASWWPPTNCWKPRSPLPCLKLLWESTLPICSSCKQLRPHSGAFQLRNLHLH